MVTVHIKVETNKQASDIVATLNDVRDGDAPLADLDFAMIISLTEEEEYYEHIGHPHWPNCDEANCGFYDPDDIPGHK